MTVPRIDLDEASPAALTRHVLNTPESQWFERKSIRVKPEVFARTLVGLANAEGGTVVLGVSEGRIEDLLTHAKAINTLRRVASTHCAPPVLARFTEREVLDGDRPVPMLFVEIAPGETLHETSAGECYLRVGDSTMRLNSTQREELAYDRGAAQFEGRPMPGATLDTLSRSHIQELADAVGLTSDPERVLSARSLLTIRGDVTIAAYLLLAPTPQEQMPHAHVRILRYLDPIRGTGARQNIADDGDIRIEGPVPVVIEKATKAIEARIPVRRALRADGKFGPVPLIPRDAWLEGLVNAVVHRSYSMAGDHIRIDIFPDRVEIESPGRFPGIVDPDNPLDISRYARNPRIARVCNDLGITQERGEGIRRIFDEMRSLGLTDPFYRETSGSVRLTLMGATRISGELAESLPTGAESALIAIRRLGRPMGTGELAVEIGLARPATLRALRALEKLGEVEWRGNSKNDPRAQWALPHHPS